MLTLDDFDIRHRMNPLGDGPWKMRGTAMVHLASVVKANGYPTFRAFVDTLEPELKTFWSQRFHLLQWYDVWGLYMAIHALGRAKNLPFRSLLYAFGRTGAHFDLTKGAHKLVSRVFGPAAVTSQFPRLAEYLWHMYGKAESERLAVNRVRIRTSDAPIMPGVAGEAVASGFLCSVVELFGGKNARTENTSMVANGHTKAGYELMDFEFHLSWD